MDVKEFLDTMSLICKKGIDTKEFKESDMGKKMAEGNPKYKTFGFDFYDMWYIYMNGDVNDYHREILEAGNFVNPPNYVAENLTYASIDYNQWSEIVKYAIFCYLRENNFTYERKPISGNKGWYIDIQSTKRVSFLIKDINDFIFKCKEPMSLNFVIGYKAENLNSSEGSEGCYDFNFEIGRLFWNLNHNEPWDNPDFFTPNINLYQKSFLNWSNSEPWEVKE